MREAAPAPAVYTPRSRVRGLQRTRVRFTRQARPRCARTRRSPTASMCPARRGSAVDVQQLRDRGRAASEKMTPIRCRVVLEFAGTAWRDHEDESSRSGMIPLLNRGGSSGLRVAQPGPIRNQGNDKVFSRGVAERFTRHLSRRQFRESSLLMVACCMKRTRPAHQQLYWPLPNDIVNASDGVARGSVHNGVAKVVFARCCPTARQNSATFMSPAP